MPGTSSRPSPRSRAGVAAAGAAAAAAGAAVAGAKSGQKGNEQQESRPEEVAVVRPPVPAVVEEEVVVEQVRPAGDATDAHLDRADERGVAVAQHDHLAPG